MLSEIQRVADVYQATSLVLMTLAAIEAAAIIYLVVPREWLRWPRLVSIPIEWFKWPEWIKWPKF